MAERTRLAYLQAMGIQAWYMRLAAPHFAFPLPEGKGAAAIEPNPSIASPRSEPKAPLPSARGVEQKGLTAPEYPDSTATGKDIVHPSLLPQTEDIFYEDVPPQTSPSSTLAEILPAYNWDELQAQVASCTRCPLHQGRTQTVFGVGDRNADWMVIGEAPGEQEDLKGEPFVGPAGLLLNEMLRAIGLLREQVFIANILKCRPPKNRDPQPAEAAACEGYLKQQLALVRPKIILAVGRIAAQNLLKTTTPVGKLRGKVHDYKGVPLVVVYHPAYLLRSPLEKRAAFDDLRLALHTYRKLITKP